MPRFVENYKNSNHWKVFTQPLLKDKNRDNLSPDNISWGEFFSVEKVREKMETEKELFEPNQLLIPLLSGRAYLPLDTIRTLPHPAYTEDAKYRDLRWYVPTTNLTEELKKYYLFMGVDTSRGGDYSSISVRTQDAKLIAHFYSKVPSDELVEVIEYIVSQGFYGRIGVEINNSGYSTIDIAKRRWWSHMLFRRKNINKQYDQSTDTLGWWTGTGTREIMLAEYEQSIRNHILTEFDDRVREETEHFANINGKPQAMPPYHDDGIMSDAICVQMFKY